MKKILVVVAHPDDEILGCGASLLKHSAKGAKITTIILTDGVTSRFTKKTSVSKKQISKRILSANRAHKYLKNSKVIFFDFPDQKLDTVPLLDIVKKIENVIKKFKPSIIYTHHHGDLNLDHRIANNATLTACRPLPNFKVKQIFTFEVLSSTEWQAQGKDLNFIPNYFNDVTNFLSKKIQILKKYKNEMRKWPHSRSFENVKFLAKSRGSMVGCDAAEAFNLVRSIED